MNFGDIAGGLSGLPEGAINQKTQNYYNEERRKTNEAFREAQMSPQERELANKIKALVAQAVKDREFTRNKVLAEMGFKTVSGPDGKPQVVRLTNEERRAMMTQSERNRSDASRAYAARAKAAFEGTTQLPSFLQKEVDTQKENETAVLKSMMGEEFAESAAAKQTMEQLKQQETAIRQSIQDQDKAIAVGASQQLSGINKAASQNRVAQYNNLTDYIAPNVNTSSGLLGYLQGERNKELQRKLDALSRKRSMISSVFTLGGLLGGQAATQYGQRSAPSTSTTPVYQTTGNNQTYMDDTSGVNSNLA